MTWKPSQIASSEYLVGTVPLFSTGAAFFSRYIDFPAQGRNEQGKHWIFRQASGIFTSSASLSPLLLLLSLIPPTDTNAWGDGTQLALGSDSNTNFDVASRGTFLQWCLSNNDHEGAFFASAPTDNYFLRLTNQDIYVPFNWRLRFSAYCTAAGANVSAIFTAAGVQEYDCES